MEWYEISYVDDGKRKVWAIKPSIAEAEDEARGLLRLPGVSAFTVRRMTQDEV